MSNRDGLVLGEEVIVFEKCEFQHSKTESIPGELVLTQNGVVFLKTSGVFRISRERLHSYEYRHIKSLTKQVGPHGFTLKVDVAQNIVIFKYNMRRKRAEQLVLIIRKEMRKTRREEKIIMLGRENEERRIREEKAEAERREREQEIQRMDEKRRRDRLTSSIMIVDESALPVIKRTSIPIDAVAQKSTDLMGGEFDFLKFGARQGDSVLIEFTAIETDMMGLDIYLLLDVSPDITSTPSGGISLFRAIEALWSEKGVNRSILMAFRALKDLEFCIIIHRREVGNAAIQFSLQVERWNEAKTTSELQ